jgi:diguanylate cyclase (GGDEF)-like protein/PAS domain S-box-containing protein
MNAVDDMHQAKPITAFECDWRSLLADVPAGIFVARAGQFLFVNARLAHMFGYSINEMLTRVSSLELASPRDRDIVLAHVKTRQVGGIEQPYDIQCQRQDGSLFDARVCALRVCILGQDADLISVIDITETHQALKLAQEQTLALAQSERSLRMSQFMLDQSPIPILAIDEQGRLRYVNEATARFLGYARSQLAEMTIFDIAPHRRLDMWQTSFKTLQSTGQKTLPSDWRKADGSTVSVELAATYLAYNEASYIVVYAHDLSSQLEAQEQAFRLAHVDEVTGLPNRQMLQERLRSEGRLAIQEGRHIALLAVEVNEVQQINESMGYALGDHLLMTLTRRLATGLRGSDILAHLGAGEFVFLLSNDHDVDEDAATQTARHIQDVLSNPVQLEHESVKVTCDIGIVVFPQDTDEPDHMLRQAQAAMRMAESQGPDQICFYTPQANARIGERLTREAALRHALDKGELYLQYQPQVDMMTGQVIGVEALVRWRNALLGEVSPKDFLPMAEETGLILPIGTWVLKSACEAAVRWQHAGLPPMRMAVNLSAKQLNQPDIACTIESILMKTGLDPHCLSIEVTEGMLMDNLDHVASTLSDLKSIGIEIALDDFGTGYSSLSNLRRLPIDIIKIDRSLVPDVTAATQDVSITRAIINMAHSLQMKVLAVGVENDGQLALLSANQCDQMQGFYFSPALHEAELITLLREKKQIPDEALGRKRRQRTLLIVDDEDNIVSSLKRLLRRDGYHIVTANSGPQGLQCLAQHDVDVIISDQRMPGMTGVEFLRRTKELYPDTIRMVLSGYTELQSITDAINEGAIYKFLTKPWDDERVRVHIQEAFRQKEMADENRRLDRQVQDTNRELAEVNSRLQNLLESQRERIHREETSLTIAREMLENIPAPVIGIDRSGMVAFMNTDAENLFDGAANLLGMHVDETDMSDLARMWRSSDGHYHDIEMQGRALRAICRPMTGDKQSRGSLMVLTPRLDAIDTSDYVI